MEVTVMPAAAPVQKQQGLNQIVINKVQKMIEGKQQGVMATITRLLEEGKIAQDFIAPIGVNLRNEDRHPVITFQAEEQVQMNMPEGNFNLHGNAISQISEKMGIPAKYLRELSAGDACRNSCAQPFSTNIRDGRAHTRTHPCGRNGNQGCTLRLVPAAQLRGHTNRIHQGSGKQRSRRVRRLYE